MSYSPAENKTESQLGYELLRVFLDYPEYQNTAERSKAFVEMIEKFADDPFYNLHYVAKAFMQTPWFAKIQEDANNAK